MKRYPFSLTYCSITFQAITQDPKYQKPYINACILFDKLEDNDKANKVLDELQANFPDHSKVLNVTAIRAHSFPEKAEEIDKNLKKISSIDPNNLLNFYNQAVYYYNTNDLEKSSQLFAKILADTSLKNIKTHPIRIFSEISLSLILEKQLQLKNARKHVINVHYFTTMNSEHINR